MNEKDILNRLESIDNKLQNHITCIAADVAVIKTDIGWIKDSCKVCKQSGQNEDKAQDINIEWLKEVVKYIAFAIIGAAIALIFSHFN